MPKITLTVPETQESVTRPIIYTVTRNLFQAMQIPPDTKIFYPGDIERGMQPGSELTQTPGVNSLSFTNKLTVEVDENYDVDNVLATSVNRPENLIVFRDDLLETIIKPVYSNTDITINFKYRAIDKTTAIRWRDDLRMRTSMMEGSILNIHDLSYHYLIPEEYFVILKEIHRCRETVDGYGDEYDKYLQEHLSTKASKLTTLAGTQEAWGVSETQMRVIGYFDFEGFPEAGSKEDDGDTWTISFSYKFKYEKPIACVMMYPLMIHNQLLSPKFRPSIADIERYDSVNRYAHKYTLSGEAFKFFESHSKIPNTTPGVAIPAFDEFIPSDIPISTLRVFTALVNIDTDNPNFLLSFKDLGKNYQLHPAILRFMVGEAPFMARKLGLSIFNLSLYRNIYIVNDYLTVDSDLNVNAIGPLSLRNYYHIRLSVVTDLSLLSKDALDRLRNNGDALKIILEYLDPDAADKIKILYDNYVTKQNLNDIIDYLNKATMSQGDWQHRGFNTVETLFITANKESDYASDLGR